MTNNDVPPEVSAYFKKIGQKSGQKIRDEVKSGKRDPNYFSKISKMRKQYGRKAKVKTSEEKAVS